MGLCRSASGSHPAPVPRCCGGAARRKDVCPCRVVMSVSARAPSSGQTARSAFRKAAATDTERARGRRKQHKDWPCPVASSWRWQRPGQPFGLPEHGGQQPGTANSLDKSCAMVCHKSRKFLFLRAGAGDGAGVLCGGRTGTGQFPHSGGKSPMGWFGERREKRSRRGESSGRRREGWCRYPRTGRDAASGRGAKGACLVGAAPDGSMPEKGTSSVCAAPKPYRVSACPGPTDHCILVPIGDRAVVCRSSFPNKARWEGEGV